jgi:hypothetical protein
VLVLAFALEHMKVLHNDLISGNLLAPNLAAVTVLSASKNLGNEEEIFFHDEIDMDADDDLAFDILGFFESLFCQVDLFFLFACPCLLLLLLLLGELSFDFLFLFKLELPLPVRGVLLVRVPVLEVVLFTIIPSIRNVRRVI